MGPEMFEHIMDNLPEELQIEPDQLTQVTQAHLVSKMIAQGEPLTLIESAWESYVIETIKVQSVQDLDINAMVLQVLQQAYDEALKDLQLQALKVKQLQEMKDHLRTQIRNLQEALLSPELSQEQRMTFQQQINALEQQLSSISNDLQLAQLNLQNQTQKQQQVIQIIPSLQQTLHDIAKAIIRNWR